MNQGSTMKHSLPKSHTDVVELFGETRKDAATALKRKYWTVRNWWRRNNIPHREWDHVEACARSAGLPSTINYELLRKLAKSNSRHE